MVWSPLEFDPRRGLREHLSPEEWRLLVRALFERHQLDAADPLPYASGSDVVWSCGGHVIKLTAPKWAWQIEAEAHWLAFAARRLGVRTPRPVARGEVSGWPYVVMTRVPGVALGSVWPELDRAQRTRLAEDLGVLMRSLHDLDVTGEADTWNEFWSECGRVRAERAAEEGVPPALARAVEPFLAGVGPLTDERRVLLHTELLDQHVLVERRGPHYVPSGLIDFADSRVGPPDYDVPALVEFVLRGEPGLLRALLLSYGEAPSDLNRERSERLLAWGLCHRYGSLRRMLQAVAPARPRTLSELAGLLYGLD